MALKLPNVFSSHAVLQQGKPITIWGWARPQEQVTAALDGRRAVTQADENGKWLIRDWSYRIELALEPKTNLPPGPVEPLHAEHPWAPAGLFNTMINPLVSYPLRGFIWYQGESNADRAWQYRTLFPALIKDWREQWADDDLSFLFVQLANFMPAQPTPAESDWAELREAQTVALGLPRTGMAVAIDIGDAADVHPRNKQDVGKRLALAALAITYGQTLVYSGPRYESMSIQRNTIRLRFQHIGGGLVARNGSLAGFAIAAADRKFVWANATIDGNTVLVSHPEVLAPVAVRYGWAANPPCNLYNTQGLPATPFRTDTFPGVTDGRR